MKLTEFVEWIDAHWLQIMATWAVIIALWKVIPDQKRAEIEKRFPRMVNFFRAIYAFGPDVIKTIDALKAIWTGKPKNP